MTREDWLALGQVVDWSGLITVNPPAEALVGIYLYPPIQWVNPGPPPTPLQRVPAGKTYILLGIGARVVSAIATPNITWRVGVYDGGQIKQPENVLDNAQYGSLSAGTGPGGPGADASLDGMLGIPTFMVFGENQVPGLGAQGFPVGNSTIAVRVLATLLDNDLYNAIKDELDPRKRITHIYGKAKAR